MKYIFCGIFFFLVFLTIDAQDEVWNTYQLDSLISVDLPGTVVQVDTVSVGVGIRQVMSTTENSIFIVQRTPFDQTLDDGTSLIKPTDLESLDELYDVVIIGSEARIPDSLYLKEKINIESFIAYRIGYVDEFNKPTFSSEILYLNNDLYIFYHITKDDFSLIEKERFFKSIQLNDFKDYSQLNKAPQFNKWFSGKLAARMTMALLFLVFVYVLIRPKK